MASSSRCSAASLLLQLALLAACCVGAALAGDRTLGTVSGPCKDQFAGIMKEQYGDDASCADKIKKAMSVAPKSDADCPGGTKANVGSDIQKCMAKNQATRDAWTSMIKTCEVLNVNERTGAGEAEAAAQAMPSCFPRFNSLSAFQSYLKGEGQQQGGSGRSAGSAAAASGGAVLLAAAAGAALML